MNKLKLLAALLANPKEVITLGLAAVAKKKIEVDYKQLNHNKHNITQLPTIDLLDLIPGFQGTIHSFTYLNGPTMPTMIIMLKSLAQRLPDCSYLELGSFRGENIVNVADVAKECTSVTLSPAEMKAMGFAEGYLTNDRIFSRNNPKITYHLGNTLTFDFSSLNKKFDLISIDADNTYSSILQDTKSAFSVLKNDSSIIVWHNYATDMEEQGIRQDILAGILDGIPAEFHKHLYHVSNTICAIFIRGNFPTTMIKFPSYPTKVFELNVVAKKYD